MISAQQLDALDPQTRQAMLSLLEQLRAKDALIAQRDREAAFKQALIDKLTHAQLDALVLGLPWQRIGEAGVITLL